MSYARKALRASAFVFTGSIFTAAAGYATNIVLARSLSLADYGLFFAVFSLVRFLLFFRDAGLNTALTKYLVRFRVSKKNSAARTAVLATLGWQSLFSFVLGAILALGSGWLAHNYFRDVQAAILLQGFFIYILLSVFVKIESSIFQAYKKFRLYALVEPVRVFTVLAAIFVFLPFGALGPLLAYIVGWLVTLLVFAPFALRALPGGRLSDVKSVSAKLFAFGIPVLFTGIGARVVGRVDTLVLTYFTDLEKVGIYNAVLPSALMFTFFAGAISPVLFSIVAELWEKRRFSLLNEGVSLLHRYLVLASAPFLLILFVFADLFLEFVFGTSFLPGVTAFRILLVAVLVYLLANINHTVISAMGRPAVVTGIVGSAAVVNVVLNIALIPRLGLAGAALATFASYLLMFLLSSYAVHRQLGTRAPIGDFIKLSLLIALFGALLWRGTQLLTLGPWTELALAIVIALPAYLLCAVLLRLARLDELKKYARLALRK